MNDKTTPDDDDDDRAYRSQPPTISLESIIRPTRDVLQAARTMNEKEARVLVDTYYQMQKYRTATTNQIRSIKQEADVAASHETLSWLLTQVETMEKQIKRALDVYSQHHEVGEWLRAVYGVGPVIAAGLLAHIDITKAPTVGHIWRFAGLDPTLKWEKGQKRPWNADLKKLCWIIGESFMKFSGRAECVYGAVYRERKQYEIERNERLGNSETAAAKIARFGKTTESYKAYALGKLPPAEIDIRARRYAVKMFLSDLHVAWYWRHFGKAPPLPYPIAILGHAHLRETKH